MSNAMAFALFIFVLFYSLYLIVLSYASSQRSLPDDLAALKAMGIVVLVLVTFAVCFIGRWINNLFDGLIGYRPHGRFWIDPKERQIRIGRWMFELSRYKYDWPNGGVSHCPPLPWYRPIVIRPMRNMPGKSSWNIWVYSRWGIWCHFLTGMYGVQR